MASNEKIVSLVEVSEVRFEALPDAPPLDDNPAVPALTEQGQDPNLGRPGGGQRIFAESTLYAGAVHNRVRVVAVISPDASLPPEATTVRVHFKSFDVDDPAPYLPDKDGDTAADAVDDNRGTPGSGVLADTYVDVAAGGTTAGTELEVSLQPGDNYRVAASTSAMWLAGLHAKQSVPPDPPVQDGALSVSGPNVTDMLTVWRTLHLEIDSMAAPPPEDTPAGAPEYAERNFIKGRVLKIETRESPDLPGNFNQYFFVEPETTTPALILADGSSQLPAASGRFQRGTLTFGEGAEAFVAADVTGNGTDATSGEYLEGWLFGGSVPPPYVIPYRATNDTLRQRVGTIAGWDAGTRVFTVAPTIADIYAGGVLRVAGQDWPITAISGGDVTVGGSQHMPMHLVDDDAPRPPTGFEVDTSLLQPLADPSANPFAQAYVLPAPWTASSATRTAAFRRNVCGDCGLQTSETEQAVKDVLAEGRDAEQSAPAFWIAYLQGGFQHTTRNDNDPESEEGAAGYTPGLCDAWGALVYTEALRDIVGASPVTCESFDAMTPLHEVGHQFGLNHECLGIMEVGCGAPHHFQAQALAVIRARAGVTACEPQPVCP